MGLIGLCCFPFGVVAGVLGFVQLMKARSEGRSPPPIAIVGLVLGGVSLVITGSAFVFSMKKSAERDADTQALVKKLEGKRDAKTLDAATACDVVRLTLMQTTTEFYDSIECAGPLEQRGELLVLEGVTTHQNSGSRAVTRACLAKGRRWYVLSRGADVECPEQAPVPKGVAPKDDEGLLTEENGWRTAEEARRAKQTVLVFEQRMQSVADAVDGFLDGDPSEKKCDQKVKVEERLQYVERPAIDSPSRGNWDFLSSDEFRTALDGKRETVDRAKAIDSIAEAGAVVGVFAADSQLWPKVTGTNEFDMGEYAGWVVLVDVKEGRVVCAATVDARSSADVSSVRLTKLESKEHALERAIEKDFRSHFKSAANGALRQMGVKATFSFDFFD